MCIIGKKLRGKKLGIVGEVTFFFNQHIKSEYALVVESNAEQVKCKTYVKKQKTFFFAFLHFLICCYRAKGTILDIHNSAQQHKLSKNDIILLHHTPTSSSIGAPVSFFVTACFMKILSPKPNRSSHVEVSALSCARSVSRNFPPSLHFKRTTVLRSGYVPYFSHRVGARSDQLSHISTKLCCKHEFYSLQRICENFFPQAHAAFLH